MTATSSAGKKLESAARHTRRAIEMLNMTPPSAPPVTPVPSPAAPPSRGPIAYIHTQS